jgi:hypothetical protein
MKTRLRVRTDQVKLVLYISIAFFARCSKNENLTENASMIMKPQHELLLDYPVRTEPGTLTLVKATLDGEISYPVTFNWYTADEQYPQTLLQVDTLTTGYKAWYSFMYPAYFKTSPYNKGPYYVRCAVKSLYRDSTKIIAEKTIKIDLVK